MHILEQEHILEVYYLQDGNSMQLEMLFTILILRKEDLTGELHSLEIDTGFDIDSSIWNMIDLCVYLYVGVMR